MNIHAFLTEMLRLHMQNHAKYMKMKNMLLLNDVKYKACSMWKSKMGDCYSRESGDTQLFTEIIKRKSNDRLLRSPSSRLFKYLTYTKILALVCKTINYRYMVTRCIFKRAQVFKSARNLPKLE